MPRRRKGQSSRVSVPPVPPPPILLRLKQLEALEKVSEKVDNVIVGNGMDGPLEDLVRIKPKG